MRDIKFRAWFIDGFHKTMGGQVCSQQEEKTVAEFLSDVENICEDHGYKSILMQYTGLKDKNGKEWFDGDIVKAPSGLFFETYFSGGCMGWKLKRNGERFNINAPLYEIAGNIYENPELLEKP